MEVSGQWGRGTRSNLALLGKILVSAVYATLLPPISLTCSKDQIFCLPIPEKAKRQHNFVVIPVHGDGVNSTPEGTAATEPIVWTFEEASGKNVVEGEDPGPGPMAEAIHHCLIKAKTGKAVIFPTEEEFASAIPQSHRKGEKAFHVKAYKGSKDGESLCRPESVHTDHSQGFSSSHLLASSGGSRSLSATSPSRVSTLYPTPRSSAIPSTSTSPFRIPRTPRNLTKSSLAC